MSEIYVAIAAVLSFVLVYVGGMFHGRQKIKELKEQNEIQKKIIDQNKKVRLNPPVLREPTPNELLDILKCLEKLEKGYP